MRRIKRKEVKEQQEETLTEEIDKLFRRCAKGTAGLKNRYSSNKVRCSECGRVYELLEPLERCPECGTMWCWD